MTAIPTDVAGNLYGTIERYEADGSIVGVTSVVEADPSAAPEIDLDVVCG